MGFKEQELRYRRSARKMPGSPHRQKMEVIRLQEEDVWGKKIKW